MNAIDIIRKALQTECGIAPETIELQTDLLRDLRVDSLDLLNASFAIEREWGVAIPVQRWLAEEYGEAASNVRYFVVGQICVFLESEIRQLKNES